MHAYAVGVSALTSMLRRPGPRLGTFLQYARAVAYDDEFQRRQLLEHPEDIWRNSVLVGKPHNAQVLQAAILQRHVHPAANNFIFQIAVVRVRVFGVPTSPLICADFQTNEVLDVRDGDQVLSIGDVGGDSQNSAPGTVVFVHELEVLG